MGEIITTSGNFLAGELAQTIYWILAVTGTVIFSILAILAFCGIGGLDNADGLDADLDPMPHVDSGFFDFKLLSFRSLMAFFTVFGWTGVLFGGHGWLGLIAATIAGLLMMILTAFLFCMVMKLQHSGNLQEKDFIGKTGTVYLTIPGGREKAGKITVTLEASTHELSAVADQEIPTGASIRILESAGERRYLVSKCC